jgi:two-component system cell cycle sensor histidine kinase/response regulator CckA
MTGSQNTPSLRGPFGARRWPMGVYFLLLVGLFMAAAGAAVLYVESETNRDARRTAVAEARFAAQRAGKELDDYLVQVQAAAKQLASNPQITKVFASPAACSLAFTGIAGPDQSHLDILRPDGTVACSSRVAPGDKRTVSYGGSKWAGAAVLAPTSVAPVVDSATGAKVSISSSPIPGGKGMVVAFVDLTAIGPHLTASYGGRHAAEFLIATRDGETVITRSIDPHRWVGSSLQGTPFHGGGDRVERADLDGATRLYAQSRVAGVGWRIFVGENKAAAMADGSRLERRQLAIILVGLLGVMLAAWLVYRKLVTPIRHLSMAVRATGADEIATAVPVSGPAEVSALGEGVNGLIRAVNEELVERRRAEAQARAVLEVALDAVITIDHEGRILEFNPAAEEMFAFKRADVLGASMAELLIPPSLRADHQRGLERYLASGEGRILGKRIEMTALRADGSEFPIEIAISRVPVEGLPVFTGYVRDLTERKQSEGRLHGLAAIVESSRDAIVGRSVEGIVTSWNAAAERLFGYRADEMIGRSVDVLAPPERGDEIRAINEQLLRGSVVAQFETVRLRKDGTRIQVESTVSPVTDATGRILGASAISRDVTGRKRVEAALRASERRYRDLFENATDLIATVDLDGRLTAVNAAFEDTLGYSRSELLGRSLHDFVPPEWHEQLGRARDGKVAGDVSSTVYEHELLAKDGRRIPIEVASRMIQEHGAAVGIEAICRDISERRQFEDQLRQGQRLEAIGRLAGGIAHDFNNLLTVISGYSEDLLERADPDSEPELREIAAAAERATILTRQMLAFSRRQLLQPRVIDLNEVVEGIMPMLKRLIGEDVDLVANLDPTLDHVLADPNQIEQVLLNLAINARDAMPQGGALTIETGNAELDENYVADHPEARVGAHSTLAVSDNGIGMDADTLARIFEPFFTTKATGTGTGLGLSTVYGIVKQSGGNVWVYSEPDKGSTFKVYLPAAAEPLTVDRPGRDDTTTATGTETVLVVEDEEAVRELAVGMLRKRGYTVLATGSPAEAVRLADEQRDQIDLLLTDLVMPEMNGTDLAAQLTARIPTLVVLFMSGYADEAAIRNGVLDHGTAYLEKPFSAADLSAKVRQALDGRSSTAGWREVA